MQLSTSGLRNLARLTVVLFVQELMDTNYSKDTAAAPWITVVGARHFFLPEA